jgi:hypothetical protein
MNRAARVISHRRTFVSLMLDEGEANAVLGNGSRVADRACLRLRTRRRHRGSRLPQLVQHMIGCRARPTAEREPAARHRSNNDERNHSSSKPPMSLSLGERGKLAVFAVETFLQPSGPVNSSGVTISLISRHLRSHGSLDECFVENDAIEIVTVHVTLAIWPPHVRKMSRSIK